MKQIKQIPFIIAEIGGNHGGSLDYAMRLTKLAKDNGADAVKFQTYSGDGLVNKYLSPERYNHFNNMMLSHEEFFKLAKYCKSINVEFMTSIWDYDSIDLYDQYLKRYKVGSGDLTNYQIIRKLIKKNKPIIISTGMSKLNEIKNLYEKIIEIDYELIKNNKLTFLHCVAMYGKPSSSFANLGFMDILRDNFPEVEIGYSDHVEGNSVVLAAIARGASCIEVHFTDNKEQIFRDHQLSVLPHELKQIRDFANLIPNLFITNNPEIVDQIETDERIQEFRRGVYFNKDINIGQIVKEADLILLRPNKGIDARKMEEIIGKKANRNILKFTPLKINYFD